MNSSDRIKAIQAILTKEFNPIELTINDDSHKHIGHKGAGQGGHFTVYVVSQNFIDMPLIKRHRLVYSALGDLMTTDIHALNIKAWTPTEFSQKQKEQMK